MVIEFEGRIFYWRGPAPFLFVEVSDEDSQKLKIISERVSYGWGMIPVIARVGATEWKTSLFPKDGRYLVPIRSSVQKAEKLCVDDAVCIMMKVDV